ncbi:hypothetical protein LTR28_005405, partial [Elasticomyces elasticus]
MSYQPEFRQGLMAIISVSRSAMTRDVLGNALPVPSLWLDVFLKIKALGYSGVSFYTDWALLEGKPGDFSAQGIFALEPFFDAAQKAGIYLLARPGPYINAEVSGGGYPGWLQRIPGLLRTTDPTYLNATDNYARSINQIIAKAQITNGGPVILVQPENEYFQADPGIDFPNPSYFGYVEDQIRSAGIVVPLLSNDAYPHGYFAPGSPAAVDIYGHDGYPLGFDCANPYTWPDGDLPTYYGTLHKEQSPSTPYSITEFQGGSFDPWGGLGFTQCAELLNEQFERVFYKNDYSFGVTIFNVYMIYGGTNWGNLGHPGGYTSYDYGAVISEERLVSREKYSEAKLEANFLQASPAYLTAIPQNNTLRCWGINLLYSSAEIFTWKKYASKTVLVVYGGPNEGHELALVNCGRARLLEGSGVKIGHRNGATILNFQTSSERRIVMLDRNLYVYVLDRNDAYNYWVIDLPSNAVSGNYTNTMVDTVAPIVKAGYLLRTVEVSGHTMALTGDINATTAIEVIGGAPSPLSTLTFNGESLQFEQDGRTGAVTATVQYVKPTYSIPDLSTVGWKYLDSLPEIGSTYDDSAWTTASLTYSNNTARNLTTPTSLYASDYGYNTGNLIYRGHFTATGSEASIYLSTQGGSAFGMSAWLNGTFLGSFRGFDAASNANSTFALPNVAEERPYVITVLIDNMGLDENQRAGGSAMKNPRGVLDYALSGRAKTAVAWK